VRIDCPEQEKEVTWVGGAVLDANGEPIMDGIMVEYRTHSTVGEQTPWAKDLKSTANPWIYDVAKMGKKEWRDEWGNWMNFYFEIEWYNPIMGNRQDTYRHVIGLPQIHTTLEWWVWVVSPSGEQLSEQAYFKTYSHPVQAAGAKEPDPQGGPPQCYIVFKHR